jgi:hypothetical protein
MVARIVPAKPPPNEGGIEGCTHVETVQAKHFGASFHTETHFTVSNESDLSYIHFLLYVTLEFYAFFALSAYNGRTMESFTYVSCRVVSKELLNEFL